MIKETIKGITEEINRLGFLLIGCTDEEERKKIKEEIEELKTDRKSIQAQAST